VSLDGTEILMHQCSATSQGNPKTMMVC